MSFFNIVIGIINIYLGTSMYKPKGKWVPITKKTILFIHKLLYMSLFPRRNGLIVYRANGFAEFRSCSGLGERKLVVRFFTGVYGSNTLFSLPFC